MYELIQPGTLFLVAGIGISAVAVVSAALASRGTVGIGCGETISRVRSSHISTLCATDDDYVYQGRAPL